MEAQPSPRKRAYSVVDAVRSGGCGKESKRPRALSLGSWEKTPMQSLASLAGLSDEEMLAATSLALVGEVGSAGSSTTSGSPQTSSPQIASPPSAATASAAAALSTAAAAAAAAAAASATDLQFFALPPMPAAKRSRAATLPCLLGAVGSSSSSGSGSRRTTDASNLTESSGEVAPSGRGCRSRSGSFQATMRELVSGTGSRPRSGSLGGSGGGSWIGRGRAETIACDGDEDGRPVNVKMIGIYTIDERRKRIERFLEKRKQRVWTKKIQYSVRKDFAETRVRVKGRFVSKEA